MYLSTRAHSEDSYQRAYSAQSIDYNESVSNKRWGSLSLSDTKGSIGILQRYDREWSKSEQTTLPVIVKMAHWLNSVSITLALSLL